MCVSLSVRNWHAPNHFGTGLILRLLCGGDGDTCQDMLIDVLTVQLAVQLVVNSSDTNAHRWSRELSEELRVQSPVIR